MPRAQTVVVVIFLTVSLERSRHGGSLLMFGGEFDGVYGRSADRAAGFSAINEPPWSDYSPSRLTPCSRQSAAPGDCRCYHVRVGAHLVTDRCRLTLGCLTGGEFYDSVNFRTALRTAAVSRKTIVGYSDCHHFSVVRDACNGWKSQRRALLENYVLRNNKTNTPQGVCKLPRMYSYSLTVQGLCKLPREYAYSLISQTPCKIYI